MGHVGGSRLAVLSRLSYWAPGKNPRWGPLTHTTSPGMLQLGRITLPPRVHGRIHESDCATCHKHSGKLAPSIRAHHQWARLPNLSQQHIRPKPHPMYNIKHSYTGNGANKLIWIKGHFTHEPRAVTL